LVTPISSDWKPKRSCIFKRGSKGVIMLFSEVFRR
jgi:hypothetical protein